MILIAMMLLILNMKVQRVINHSHETIKRADALSDDVTANLRNLKIYNFS
jgi:hypothetical protein